MATGEGLIFFITAIMNICMHHFFPAYPFTISLFWFAQPIHTVAPQYNYFSFSSQL